MLRTALMLTLLTASLADAQPPGAYRPPIGSPVPPPEPRRDERGRDDDRYPAERGDAYDRYDDDDRPLPPGVPRERTFDRGWHRYERFGGSPWAGAAYRWVQLTDTAPARRQRARFLLPPGIGRIDRLRIEAVRGAPAIRHVRIEYASGLREIYRVNMRLPRGSGSVIDLPGRRRIAEIIVVTDPRSRGAYTVLGG